jgi:hypothetical protein
MYLTFPPSIRFLVEVIYKGKIPKFSQYNVQQLRWENIGIFSQSQPHIYFVTSQYNTFRGVD